MGETFVEVSPFCAKFLTVQLSETPDTTTLMSDTQHCLDKIGELMNKYSKNEGEMPDILFKYSMPDNLAGYNHEYLYMIQKGQKLQKKYNFLYHQHFVELLNQLGSVVTFIGTYIDNMVPVIFDYDGFDAKQISLFSKNEKVRKIVTRISLLNDKIARTNPREWEVPTIEELREVLTESSKDVLIKEQFSPEGAFDDKFYYFLKGNKMLQRFTDAAKQFAIDGNVNLTENKQLTISFLLLIQPKTQEEQRVLICAMLRIVFAELLETGCAQYNSQGNENEFVEKALKLSKMHMIDFGINKNVMTPDMYDVPLDVIVKQREELSKAKEIFSTIPFYSSPLDIVHVCYCALNNIMEFAKQNCELNNTRRDSLMSFDDVFSLFCAVVTIDPSASLVPIVNFLKGVKRMSLSSAYDFSKMLLISSIDYIFDAKLDDTQE